VHKADFPAAAAFSRHGSAGLNALTFDTAGKVYGSDSANSIIWKTGRHYNHHIKFIAHYRLHLERIVDCAETRLARPVGYRITAERYGPSGTPCRYHSLRCHQLITLSS